jgi:lysophospholipase L1-like esterase
MKSLLFVIVCWAGCAATGSAQNTPAAEQFPFVRGSRNIIHDPQGTALQPFYAALDCLLFRGLGQIHAVHIGGSHVQADIFPGQLRERLQTFFPGNEGSRGLLFPFKIAKTNNPANFTVSYSGNWGCAKNVQDYPAVDLGLTGIAVYTSDSVSSLGIGFPNNQKMEGTFSRMRIYEGAGSGRYEVQFLGGDSTPVRYEVHRNDTTNIRSIHFVEPQRELRLRICRKGTDLDARQVAAADWSGDTLHWKQPEGVRTGQTGDGRTGQTEGEQNQRNAGEFRRDVDLNSVETRNNIDNRLTETRHSVQKPAMDPTRYDTTENWLHRNQSREPGESLSPDSAYTQSRNPGDTLPLVPVAPPTPYILYGVQLENDDPGITYHSVGVNGASTHSFLKCTHFDAHLAEIKPDLVLFGLGINDAAKGELDTAVFTANYTQLIRKVRAANPRAAVLLLTNSDSYRPHSRRSWRPNPNALRVQKVMHALAQREGVAVWDLFEVMGGLGSAKTWETNGLLQHDKVHFTGKGYTLLGDLLFEALINHYQTHLSRQQNE